MLPIVLLASALSPSQPCDSRVSAYTLACGEGVAVRYASSCDTRVSSFAVGGCEPAAAGVRSSDGCGAPLASDACGGSASVFAQRPRPVRRLLGLFQNRPRLFGRSSGGCN